MSIVREWVSRLRDTLRPRRSDRDLEEELQLHLEMAAEAQRRRGGPAHRDPRVALGHPAAAMDALRDQRGMPWLADLAGDIRYALRGLVRNPGFSAVAILTLALGTGANTAIFSLVNALILRPLPVRAPEELVELLSRYPDPEEPRHNIFGRDFYERLREQNQVFADLAGVAPVRAKFRIGSGAGDREELYGSYVTGSFFPMLGLEPLAGRFIGPGDDRPDGAASGLVVISQSYWRRRFNLDPGILGTRLIVDGAPATIIGVAPRSFAGLHTGRVEDLWLPTAMATEAPGRDRLALFGRLKAGVSREQARAALAVWNQRFEETARATNDPQSFRATLDVESARSGANALRDRYGNPLLVLMTLVAVLLAIACANLAGMLLARGAARQREMALRVSLGAGRGRLIRQVLTESLLLSIVGSLLGIVVAYLAAEALVRILVDDLLRGPGASGLDIVIHSGPDARVLAFTTGVALLTGAIFGLAPAWQALSFAPASTLREIGGAGEPRSRRLFGKVLVVAQVALSVALLSGAGLFVRHLANLRGTDLGFQRDSILLVSLDPAESGYDRDQLSAAYRDLLGRLEAIPGVRSATLSAVTPIHGAGAHRLVRVDGFDESPEARRHVSLNWVAPKYFETFGTPVIAGREFRFADTQGPRVAIINQAMARYYFGEASAIGRHVTLDGENRPYEIIGVVGDAKYYSLRVPAPRTMYFHAFRSRDIPSHFALQTAIEPKSISGAVQQVVRETLKPVRIANVTTLADQMDASIVVERVVAGLAAWFGTLGALLAAIGLYGLIAYSVVRRTNEIGIRMALGATRSDIIAMVVKSALVLVLAGLAAGLPVAFWSERLASRLIEGLPATTPLPVVVGALSMVALSLLAAYLPARRAAGIAPVDALRHE
jgi:predicted permease